MRKVLSVALQTQLAVGIGVLISLLVSLYYMYLDDSKYPKENPYILIAAFLICIGCFAFGHFLSRRYELGTKLSIKEGSMAVILSWVFATAISTFIFVAAGFPDPHNVENFSISRRIVDGVFESISGYTTAGGSILPSVEAFPRGILTWRSTTHILGGMGMTFIMLTVWRRFKFKREQLINSEAEGPNSTEFETEKDAITAGIDFMKIYVFFTLLLFVLLLGSGLMFRNTPYDHAHEAVFDALNHSFSVMGTGGFGTYDSSAGLPITERGVKLIGGLRNPLSEWIIAFFMFFAGSNLGLWYVLIFKQRISDLYYNTEFRVYTAFVAIVTTGIWLVLMQHNVYESPIVALRYAFFNVNTILSTTGLATFDFTLWPAAAEGLLFACYLVGGMVGSTAGGLKMIRFVVLYKYTKMKIQNLIYGKHRTRFSVDGVVYDDSSVGLIISNIVLYFAIFMLGAIAIMITTRYAVYPDGTIGQVDFTSAITASIANLGNIGPAVEIGNINAGPTGNYFAYSEMSKLVMSLLMLTGRLGVITMLIPFITDRGMKKIKDSIHEQHFDSDEHIFHKD